MSRTQYSVSMLCSSVGRPNKPTCATYGGRKRGIPRLPSIDSIIADSSPQMYAPAPRRNSIFGKHSADELIATLESSSLRGLGGAGFPAGRKWRIVRGEPAPRLMAVNIDEGEPGT